MFDLLTPDESRHAAACGWQLNTVYDMNKERWAIEIMPCDHPKTSAYHTQARVVGLARTGDAVAVRALQLVVRSYQPPKPNRKKAKPHDSKAPAR